jgi:hypothetical protein
MTTNLAESERRAAQRAVEQAPLDAGNYVRLGALRFVAFDEPGLTRQTLERALALDSGNVDARFCCDVRQILKRGAIDNDDDFRLVRNQVEDADKEATFSPGEIELIRKLLVTYEVAKGERSRKS